MRKVIIGDQVYNDETPATLFASDVTNFRNLKKEQQVLDVENYSLESSLLEWDSKDKNLTIKFRESAKSWGRVFPMSKLTVGPMLSKEDGCSLLLPYGNRLGKDWLTYSSPEYREFIFDLCNVLYNKATTESEKDSIKTLMVDYAANVPYASSIRHDGTLTVGPDIWTDEAISQFCALIAPLLINEFEYAETDFDKYLPPLNVSKSTGFNCLWPDGRLFDKKQHFFVPKELWRDQPNNICRYDFSDFKIAWLSSGRVKTGLRFFLEHCDRYDDFAILSQAFEMEQVSVHTEAYRTNNSDVPILDFNGDFRSTWGKGRKKDRVYGYEVGDYKFSVGKVDDQKYTKEFFNRNPNRGFTLLKKRPMYPGPNASFSVSFILLFKTLVTRVEESEIGFPSNRTIVLDGFDRFFRITDGMAKTVFSFDRTNAEQFISDNFSKVIQMLPEWLGRIVKGLGIAILPSTFGGRIVSGGLCSGTPQTTFLNAIVGGFEMCNALSRICSTPLREVQEKYLEALFQTHNSVIELGDYIVHINLGTDDQVCIIASTNSCDSEAFTNSVDESMQSFLAERSLSGGASRSVVVFGLEITTESVRVSQTLGLSKLFLMEKTRNGDACALKMFARLQALPNYYSTLETMFLKHGFGDISSYKRGADNFRVMLAKFGYPVEGLFNVHSPVDALIIGSELAKTGKDPRTYVKKYPSQYMIELYDIFKSYINEYRSKHNG